MGDIGTGQDDFNTTTFAPLECALSGRTAKEVIAKLDAKGLRTARASLKQQLVLVPALLRGLAEKCSVAGCRVDFAWRDAKFAVLVSADREVGAMRGGDDWMVYQVTPNLARNGDAVQMMTELLRARRLRG